MTMINRVRFISCAKNLHMIMRGVLGIKSSGYNIRSKFIKNNVKFTMNTTKYVSYGAVYIYTKIKCYINMLIKHCVLATCVVLVLIYLDITRSHAK